LFGGNGGLFGSTIGNPKYLGGLGGFEPPPTRSNDCITKIIFTFLVISSCKLTNSIFLGVYGLDLTLSTIWMVANTNKALVNIIIDWGIAT
jgi:hypothetical protein